MIKQWLKGERNIGIVRIFWKEGIKMFMKRLSRLFSLCLAAAVALAFSVPGNMASAKENYEKVYKSYTNNNKYFKSKTFSKAAYADLNSDGTPELILWSDNNGTDDWILSIAKNHVKASNLRGTNTVKYIKGKNRIYVSGNYDANSEKFDDVYEINNGFLRWIAGGSRNKAGKYNWNGSRVTKSEYTKDLKKAKGSGRYINAFSKDSEVRPSEW